MGRDLSKRGSQPSPNQSAEGHGPRHDLSGSQQRRRGKKSTDSVGFSRTESNLLARCRGTSLDAFAKAMTVSEALESDKLTLIVFVGDSPPGGSSAGFRPEWL